VSGEIIAKHFLYNFQLKNTTLTLYAGEPNHLDLKNEIPQTAKI